jgi:hypothetical protein
MKKSSLIAAAFAISGMFTFAVANNSIHAANRETKVYRNTIDTIPKPNPNPNPKPSPNPSPNPKPNPTPNPNPNPNPNPPNPNPAPNPPNPPHK